MSISSCSLCETACLSCAAINCIIHPFILSFCWFVVVRRLWLTAGRGPWAPGLSSASPGPPRLGTGRRRPCTRDGSQTTCYQDNSSTSSHPWVSESLKCSSQSQSKQPPNNDDPGGVLGLACSPTTLILNLLRVKTNLFSSDFELVASLSSCCFPVRHFRLTSSCSSAERQSLEMDSGSMKSDVNRVQTLSFPAPLTMPHIIECIICCNCFALFIVQNMHTCVCLCCLLPCRWPHLINASRKLLVFFKLLSLCLSFNLRPAKAAAQRNLVFLSLHINNLFKVGFSACKSHFLTPDF